MKKIIILLMFLLIMPFVYAKEYHIPLLAVRETTSGFEGSTADLYLEIQKGKGRIFLDTYPLTKLDTQMSTRFAKEIACSEIDFDCSNYDFIYTIKSDSVIVGGPSAGAAITLLTIAALENLELNENITITGTINSGGLIGPVGGLKEKIDAASEIGIITILIPHGERTAEIENITIADYVINISIENKSIIDLIKYGKSKGVNVLEVSTIDEVLYYITGREIKKLNQTLEIDKEYMETMKSVTNGLCSKALNFQKELSINEFEDSDQKIFENAVNLTKRYKKAVENEKYYSAASYCFGANTKFAYLTLKQEDLTNSEILTKITEIKSHIANMNKVIDEKKLKTITDLETYMIVKERIIEAEENIDKVLDVENTTEKIYYLSYGMERLNSAISWSVFFDKGQKEFVINEEDIKKSCMDKIYEAEERYNYLNTFSLNNFEDTQKEINLAKNDLENGDYELCLFKASKAKANSDLILNTIGVEESQLLDVTNQKLDIIKNNIIEGQREGVFPVIGYSYYEYANDLKERDIFSSMLFVEYSLELSNLDIYFKEKSKKIDFNIDFDNNVVSFVLIFISGLLIGIWIGKKKPKK
ncbi:hypothetical protein CEE44_01810 [Candidatus Woesearchaeota archaeon B3_Woes]|nr:MAG: hypothetical protein CEE44_01810 [Candidatus Woesearchaeota archaeon B3_Woes]